MISLPNILSFARLLSVPLIVWLVLDGEMTTAFWLFVLSGITEIGRAHV